MLLVVEDTRLPTHRAILAALSPVFRAMFYGLMCERVAKEVHVQTFAASTMKLFLRFVYSGRLQDVAQDELVPLMACADHYCVASLRGRHRRALV